MSENGKGGGDASEGRKGFFARFKRDRPQEKPEVTEAVEPVKPLEPENTIEAAAGISTTDTADESRFSRFRRVFSRGQSQDGIGEGNAEQGRSEVAETPAPHTSESPAVAVAEDTQQYPHEPAVPAENIPATEAPLTVPVAEPVPQRQGKDLSALIAAAQAAVNKPSPTPVPVVEAAGEIIPDANALKNVEVVRVEPVVTEVPEVVTDPPARSAEPVLPVTEVPASQSTESPLVPVQAQVETAAAADTPVKEDRFGKIKRALERTRKGLGRIFLGRKQIDDELLETLETHLLTADLGVEVTAEVIEELTARVKRKELDDVDALQKTLRSLLVEILKPCEVPLDISTNAPYALMVVGVNGVGKTTTIGKLAKQYLKEGHSVILAAGDTFRAAAVEQLQVWGERNRVPVVAQHTGADSASVIYDAFESAKARQIKLLIADTAGRLHTKSNLMDELKKIKRVLGKLDGSAPHEVLLVLDAGTGQNAVVQLQQFHEAVGVTGLVLTKLDGTAKGGVIFALCRRFGIPVRYIGVGEGVDDLQPFRAEDFVDALLATDKN